MEQYDYIADPNASKNIAKLPENKVLVDQLSEQLKARWMAAISDIPEHLRQRSITHEILEICLVICSIVDGFMF